MELEISKVTLYEIKLEQKVMMVIVYQIKCIQVSILKVGIKTGSEKNRCFTFINIILEIA